MTTLVFLDTETTGLDPDRHEVWEVALIVQRDQLPARDLHVLRMPNLLNADETALRIGGFYDRIPTLAGDRKDVAWKMEGGQAGTVVEELLVRDIAECTAGAHLVGAVPDFDARFLRAYLRRFGLQPAWHYHLIDVEALAAGKLRRSPPWDSHELGRALGVEQPESTRHTAMGDARWAKAMYEAVMA